MTSLFALFGALFGSFANVIIVRLPRGGSIAFPASHCPKCKTPIRWYDNIPILSYLILRGQCRHCGVKISWRYPVVELIMALTWGALFYFVGWQWVLFEYLIFVFGLVTVSFIDFEHMILPDVFTLGGIVLGLFGAAINPERTLMGAVGGVLMGGGFLWAIAYIYLSLRDAEGMGGGDIKLLGWIGALLGWKAIPFVILSSSLLGSVVGIFVMLWTKGGMKTAIPFGPYLALGALWFIFGGQGLADWYFGLFIPSLADSP